MKNLIKYFVLIAIAAIVLSTGLNAQEKLIEPSAITQLVLLGTGTPNAEPDRAGSAVAVVVNDVPYIVDCGAGVVRRANEAFQNGVKGLNPKNIKRAFITHLHSDHTTGYADLIFTPAVLERDAPLHVFGPPGIREMTDHILKAYQADIDVRITGLEPAIPEGYKVIAKVIEPGVVYRDENITVKAFAVKHGAWDHAYAFRFETPDRVIVISGDTVPMDEMVEQAKGCDILVHEVYSQAGWERRAPKWQAYHKSAHTSTLELGEIAAKAKPGLLILTHQLLWGSTEEEMMAEVRSVYNGKVVWGRDLDVY